MTGIERLREVVRELGRFSFCYDLYETLGNIADQIEREQDEMVADSPYDAILPEDRDAVAWVREHGGLSHVKDIYHDLRAVVERLGIEWSESELHGLMDTLDRRLMPEGCEWPTVDGEPVVIGERMRSCGIEDCKVVGIDPVNARLFLAFDDIKQEKAIYFPDSAKYCHRPAPKVLAADGEPLEVGQMVYHIESGDEFTVTGVDAKSGDANLRWGYDFEMKTGSCAAELLTHQRPVLDADGVPIKVGDTVWHIKTSREYVVVEPSYGETVVVRLAKYDDAEGEQHAPDQLTHTKPEPPDSCERIADEIDRLREEVALHLGDYLYDEDGNDSIQLSMECVAKRCRALAERERGE